MAILLCPLHASYQVVYEWACGTSFAEICQLTEVMEGAIVRTVMRLDETCREFRDAARIMGNTQLLEQVRSVHNHTITTTAVCTDGCCFGRDQA